MAEKKAPKHTMATQEQLDQLAKEKRPVVVSSVQAGRTAIHFGYLEEASRDSVILVRARMCVWFTEDVRGLPGLAAVGPSASCRVSFPTPRSTIFDINAIHEASSEAVTAWEAGPWAARA